MIFSTELADKIEIVSDSKKYLEAGIHDNVKLTEARTAVSVNGNTFLEIKFEKDGKELTHTEWEPTPYPGATEEQTQQKATNQVKRIMQILCCFYPKEALIFAGTSYKSFVEWVCGLLNNADKNKLLKVKVVYNAKGYTTLPSYAKFAFIEPMVLPEGQESKITQLNIDMFTRPIVADKEEAVVNPLENNTPEKTDDLPF